MSQDYSKKEDTVNTNTKPSQYCSVNYKFLVEGLRKEYIFYRHDTEGNFEYLSPSIEDVLGYTIEEFLSHYTDHMTDSPINKKAQEYTCGSLQGIQQPHYEAEYYHKNGSIVNIETVESPIFDNNGKVIAVEGIVHDITPKKKAEKELKELNEKLLNSNKELELYLNTIRVILLVLDKNGDIKLINPRGCEILGFKKNELIGSNWFELCIPKEIREEVKNIHIKHIEEKIELVEYFENEVNTKDGKKRTISWHNAIIRDISGNIIGTLSSGEDITDKKEMQKKLLEKEELMLSQSRSAAMGDMISMIAHQWKQPLAALSMIANNMKADYELETFEAKNIEKYYSHIDRQIQYLSKTIDDFRNFFKPNKTKQLISVQNIIDDSLNLIGKSLENNNIELIKDFKKTREILIFPNELFHTLINIINNAKEALDHKNSKDRKIFISSYESKGYIYISIEDNAGGISQKIMDRIFEPYFTTKHKLNGTGIGLYMAKTIIEKHFMGRIDVENTKQGAKFTLVIPIC